MSPGPLNVSRKDLNRCTYVQVLMQRRSGYHRHTRLKGRYRVDPTKRRVLIIEDEQELADLLKRHLEDNGFAVETVGRGDDGVRLAEAEAFDLILLDLMLPGMDGIEVCRRLRARTLRTPIVMVTARSTEVEKVLGLEMGADDYIAKPFGLAELTARVKAILRRVDALQTTVGADALPITLSTGVRKPGRSWCAATRSASLRRSTTSCCTSREIPAGSIAARNSSTRCGATVTTAMNMPSTATSTGCGARSNAIMPNPNSC